MVVFVRDAAASKKLGGARDYLGNEVLPLKKGQFWKFYCSENWEG